MKNPFAVSAAAIVCPGRAPARIALLALVLGLTACEFDVFGPGLSHCGGSGLLSTGPCSQGMTSGGSYARPLDIEVRPDTMWFEADASSPPSQMLYINQTATDGEYPTILVSVRANRRVTIDGPWQHFVCDEKVGTCTGYVVISRDTLSVPVSVNTVGLGARDYGNITVDVCDRPDSTGMACAGTSDVRRGSRRAWWFQTSTP